MEYSKASHQIRLRMQVQCTMSNGNATLYDWNDLNSSSEEKKLDFDDSQNVNDVIDWFEHNMESIL